MLHPSVTPTPNSAAQPDDRDLVERAKSGDKDAFGQLYALHRPKVLGAVRAIVGDPHTAQDLTSEAFLRAYQAIGVLNAPNRFDNWVSQIGRNLAKNHLGRIRLRNEVATESLDDRPVPDSDPAETVARLPILRAALRVLKPRARAIVAMRVLDGMTLTETAAAVGLAPAVVSQIQHRALARLRQTPQVRAVLSGGMA